MNGNNIDINTYLVSFIFEFFKKNECSKVFLSINHK